MDEEEEAMLTKILAKIDMIDEEVNGVMMYEITGFEVATIGGDEYENNSSKQVVNHQTDSIRKEICITDQGKESDKKGLCDINVVLNEEIQLVDGAIIPMNGEGRLEKSENRQAVRMEHIRSGLDIVETLTRADVARIDGDTEDCEVVPIINKVRYMVQGGIYWKEFPFEKIIRRGPEILGLTMTNNEISSPTISEEEEAREVEELNQRR